MRKLLRFFLSPIQNLFLIFLAPFIELFSQFFDSKEDLLVKKGQVLLAKLQLLYGDQFWQTFKLERITKDESLLEELFSEEFWFGKEVFIQGENSLNEYKVLLSAEHYDMDGLKASSPLKERPLRISLRVAKIIKKTS